MSDSECCTAAAFQESNCPSDDSGSDDEENLRVSRSLKTFEQVLDQESGISVHWPSVCQVCTRAVGCTALDCR